MGQKVDRTKYKNQYAKDNYDALRINVQKGNRAKLQEYCKNRNISVNKLINNYIDSLLGGEQ